GAGAEGRPVGPSPLPPRQPQAGRAPDLRDREAQGEEETMKYFTPQLLAAYGADDRPTWSEAEARWDEACERYSAYLETIKGDFPPGLRRIEDSYSLHDAK